MRRPGNLRASIRKASTTTEKLPHALMEMCFCPTPGRPLLTLNCSQRLTAANAFPIDCPQSARHVLLAEWLPHRRFSGAQMAYRDHGFRVGQSGGAGTRGISHAPLLEIHRSQVVLKRWGEDLMDECQRLAIMPEDVLPAPEGALLAKASAEIHQLHFRTSAF